MLFALKIRSERFCAVVVVGEFFSLESIPNYVELDFPAESTCQDVHIIFYLLSSSLRLSFFFSSKRTPPIQFASILLLSSSTSLHSFDLALRSSLVSSLSLVFSLSLSLSCHIVPFPVRHFFLTIS